MEQSKAEEMIVAIRTHGEMLGYATLVIGLDQAKKKGEEFTIDDVNAFCLTKIKEYLEDDTIAQDERAAILEILHENEVI